MFQRKILSLSVRPFWFWQKAGMFVMNKLLDLLYFLEDTIDDVRLRLRKAKTPGDRIQALFPVVFPALILLLILVLLCTMVPRLLSGSHRTSPVSQVSQKDSSDSDEGADLPSQTFPEKTVTLGSTGCMLLHSPFLSSYGDAEGEYDFSEIYRFITPYYSAPDYMVCEFEGSLSGPQTGYSGHPLFRSPDIIIENIRDSGVDLQLLATNHVYDGSSAGLHRMLSVYEEKGISYTGAREKSNQSQYYIADIDGIRVGFLNYVYRTSDNGISINGIPVYDQDADLINTFSYQDLETFYEEVASNLEKMRQSGARFLVLNLHWGDEYQLTESEVQRTMAQRLCELGVDALIGGHPHCEQPIDVFENASGDHKMFCIFSVGNALTNQRAYLISQMPDGHTEDGVVVTLSLHQATDGTVSIADVDLLPTWVYRFQDNGSKYYILPLDDVSSLESVTGLTGIQADAQASYERTMEELGLGLEKAKAAFSTK